MAKYRGDGDTTCLSHPAARPRRSKPIIWPPNIPHPPLVNISALGIEPQIAAKSDPAESILVLHSPVNHIRIVKDNIAGGEIGGQPPPSLLVGFTVSEIDLRVQLDDIVGKLPILRHVLVETVDAFFRRKVLGTFREVGFDGFANVGRVLQVHQPTAFGSAVAERYPCG